MIGAPLPDPDEPLPEDAEYQMSAVIAQAAQKLYKRMLLNTATAKPAAMQDPITRRL